MLKLVLQFAPLVPTPTPSLPQEVGWYALPVSLMAAVIAAIALWRTQFSRGKLLFALGTASISITEWKSGKSQWITPDLSVPLSIANTGAQAIVIYNLRIRAKFPKLPIPNAHEIWWFNSELDLDSSLEQGLERTTIAAMKGSGVPLIILPKTTVDKRFVFWTRWEKPVIQEVTFDLEVQTSRRSNWKAVGSWEFDITHDGWVYLAREGGRFGIVASGDPEDASKNERYPADLHKYTGTQVPFPSDSGLREPSYVVTEDDESA